MTTYRSIVMPDHPLADSIGVVREHRVVLYAKIGPGTHACNWCGKPVTWRTPDDPERSDMLVVDHLDMNGRNNDPGNLVPSCTGCNLHRHAPRPHWNAVRDDELFVIDNRGYRQRAGKRTCVICGTEFLRELRDIKRKGGHFCSDPCMRVGRRG